MPFRGTSSPILPAEGGTPAHSLSPDVKRQAIFLARWAGRGAFKASHLHAEPPAEARLGTIGGYNERKALSDRDRAEHGSRDAYCRADDIPVKPDLNSALEKV
jgi:hypothetical protein